MSKMWWLAAVIAAGLLVTGCESPHNSESPSENRIVATAKRTQGDYEVSKQFEGRAEELGAELAYTLFERCRDDVLLEKYDGCVRDRLLAAFDVKGAVEPHCPPMKDLESGLECIAMGALAYDLAERAGGEALRRFDWNNVDKSAIEAITQMVMDRVGECLNNGSASSVNDCVMNGTIKHLGLIESDIAPCEAISDDQQFGQCVGEAYGAKAFELALQRI